MYQLLVRISLASSLSLLVLCAHAQGVGPTAERRYALSDRGFLALAVPAGWKQEVRQRDTTIPPTIIYGPDSGSAFQVLVTPIWPMKEGVPQPTPEAMKSSILRAIEGVKSQAVEKSIDAIELKGKTVHGYYFQVTDRAPKPGEYKYMAQGMVGLEEIRVTFTILTNDGHRAVTDAALAMIRDARRLPK